MPQIMEHIYVECPNVHNSDTDAVEIFLAGGIFGCPDWQEKMVELLKQKVTKKKLIIYNPRRAVFDSNTDLKEQIEWEHEHLMKSKIVLFWFPKETLCPITLYELGNITSIVEADRDDYPAICIGCHPDYARRKDVVIQTQLRLNDLVVASSLEELADHMKILTSKSLKWVSSRNITKKASPEEIRTLISNL